MLESKYLINTIFIVSLLTFSLKSVGQKPEHLQQQKPEVNDSLLLALNIEDKSSENIKTDKNIENSIAYPADKLYNNSWHNTDIKLSIDKHFDKNTTYILPLLNSNNEENNFVFPYKGKVISKFGYRGRRVHTGTDIKLSLNDEVYAAFDGVVRMAKRYSGYGNIVVIRHYNGLETCYAHLNKIKVNVNQKVKAGDIVGLGGRTGRATTTHLHFETRFLGDAFNPEHLLDFENYNLKSDTLTIDKNTFLKSKKFIYKKNKRGKRIKVYLNDSDTDENIVKENPSKTIETINDLNTNNDTIKGNTVTSETQIKQEVKKENLQKPRLYYKVRSGDTLSKIAKRNNTTIKNLCRLNNIEENTILSLGKKIKLK